MRHFDYSDLKSHATDGDQKQLMLKMLLEFDAFCAKHGLTYYLSGGTLLGAARHKGFIPWDDDIDVNMPRPDCEKLMELSGGFIGEYELMPPNSSVQYFSYHWKMYATDILVAKRNSLGIGAKVYPVFMDIFPIEGLPDTEAKNIEHYATIRRLKDNVNHARGMRRYGGRNPLLFVINRIKSAHFKRVGASSLFDKVIAHAKSIPYESAEHVGVMMTNVHTVEERVVKSEYSPVVTLDFEGHPASCPSGYDTYLRQLYGSKYMEWLPLHEQFPRHNFAMFHAYRAGEKPEGISLSSTNSSSGTPDSEDLDMQLDEL
jgi:lipopolysaccharide cholinephosphotransferase